MANVFPQLGQKVACSGTSALQFQHRDIGSPMLISKRPLVGVPYSFLSQKHGEIMILKEIFIAGLIPISNEPIDCSIFLKTKYNSWEKEIRDHYPDLAADPFSPRS